MEESKAYTGLMNSDYMPLLSKLRYFFLVIFASVLATIALAGQDETPYDEFPVYVKVPYIGVTEIDAVIRGETVFLSVPGLFDFLKIRNIPAADLETVTGFFINPGDTYAIDRAGNRITYGNKTWDLAGGELIRSETDLYLRSDYFGKVFGLECSFSFRDLMVTIDTKLELPAIREMRQEEMRRNITRLRGEVTVDTTIGRTYPGFRFGMADWSVYASEQPDGQNVGRFNLSLGSVIAGGEANASLIWYTGTAFSEKQQYYMWRHVNNDRTWMRQVIAGKINAQAVSSIYNPVLGVQVTNRPTTFRRSFGTYTLTDRTEPGWTVELYVNNVLVDYVKADASGLFTFEVPLVYGNTLVKLKFYGPWGEERTREQNINIPYNFLPHKELEYTVSAGVVEDTLWSRLARTTVRYGATKYITLGAGFEYLSSVPGSPLMPFADASVRITNNLLVSGEYTHRVRSRGTLTWRLPSNIQLDLLYARYDKDQKAISYNYLEERKASLSLPVRIARMAGYSRLSYYQIIFPESQYTSAEWVLAASFSRVSANLTTYGVFSDYFTPSIYSNLSLGVRLPANFVIMPQAQYNYSGREFISAKINLEKRLFRNGYMNGSFEHNFRYNMNIGEVGIRWDFSFAQAGISARQTNEYTTFVQYARGSLINDRKTSFTKADNRTNVGRGGISVIAFLDLNANGLRDQGEPKAAGLNIRSNGGRIERNEEDTIIHIIGLEPYVKHFIEVDENNFDNISWRIPKKIFAVVVDPNMLKTIEIPVNVAGEATGTVMLEKEGKRTGQSRIIVNFHNSAGVIIGRALSEDDGYFSYFGLTPGDYLVAVDTAQLRRLDMTSEPESLTFSIRTDIEGDYVQGLDFTLRKKMVKPEPVTASDTSTVARPDTAITALPPMRTIQIDTSYLVIHEVTRELVTITEDYYAVQFGAFRNKLYAEIMKQKVDAALDKNVELFEEDGFWKVRITGFENREDLESYIPVIHGQGITEIWIITNKAVKEAWVTATREDSLAVVRETVTEEPVQVVVGGNTIQLGAFETVEETTAVSDRLLAATEKLVTIRKEEGVYKVQLSGFADTSEIREFIPLLKQHGFKDITVLHQTRSDLIPVVPAVIPEVAEKPVVPEAEEIPVPLPEPEPPVVKPEHPEISEEAAPPPVPRFVLHAGNYHKRSQAERAKRKIERNLDLPVEILEEWDSYRVVVTGFFTREETYPFYPELAGLGFSEVFVYEKPLIDR
jgi:cell division protein FtsN